MTSRRRLHVPGREEPPRPATTTIRDPCLCVCVCLSGVESTHDFWRVVGEKPCACPYASNHHRPPDSSSLSVYFSLHAYQLKGQNFQTARKNNCRECCPKNRISGLPWKGFGIHFSWGVLKAVPPREANTPAGTADTRASSCATIDVGKFLQRAPFTSLDTLYLILLY
jgi:hypothetical protein